MSDRYLEDFAPGFEFTTVEYDVTEAQVREFAMRYDPQPYHLDPEAGRASVFGSLVAGGFQAASLVWALVVREGIFSACSRAGLGVEDLRWRAPLRPGDRVHVHGRVLDTRESDSRPDAGILRTRYRLINQDGQVVVEYTLITLLARRSPRSAEVASGLAR